MLGEKEMNVNLLNELDLLERLEMADGDGEHEKLKAQIALKKDVLNASFIRSRLSMNSPFADGLYIRNLTTRSFRLACCVEKTIRKIQLCGWIFFLRFLTAVC